MKKRVTAIFIATVAVVFTCFLAACKPSAQLPDAPQCEIIVADVTVEEGQSVTVSPEAKNYDGEKEFLLEVKAGNDVARADGMKIIGLKPGSATLKCTLLGTDYSVDFVAKVTQKADLSEISVKDATITVGEKTVIRPEVKNYDGEKKFSYEIISGGEYITVSGGEITAVAPGVAIIEAALDGSRAKTTFTCTVVAPDYKLTFEAWTITLTEGENAVVTPVLTPALEGAEFLYTVVKGASSVRVKEGVISALEAGTATVECRLVGYENVRAEFTVTVNARAVVVPEGYVKIGESLYASVPAGRYKKEQTIDFITTEKNAYVYYTTDSSPVFDNLSNARKWKGKTLIRQRTGLLSEYRLTTQVDGALDWAGPNKNRSEKYVQEMQNNGNYNLIDLAYVYNVAVVRNGEILERAVSSYILFPSDDFDNVPIISLSMPEKNWFDGVPNGRGKSVYNNVYIPGGNAQADNKARANLEFFDQYGYSFSTNTQVKVGGGWSRGRPQRTLHLNFNKDENGNKQSSVNFEIFGNREKRGEKGVILDEFTRFRLWNGGSRYEDGLRFNDAYLQLLAQDLNVATAAVQPAIVYLNGEFWGMYYIREHYADVYFKTNYNVKKDDVQYFDYVGGTYNVSDGDEVAANEFIAEMNAYLDSPEKDFTDDEVYNAFFDKYVDEASMIDCMIMQAWCGNWDFVGNGNNHRVWRVSKPKENNIYTDGKLRFILHDLDMGMELQTLDGDFSNLLSAGSAYSLQRYNLFNRALANAGFRRRLYERAVEICNNQLAPVNSINVLNELADAVKPLINYNVLRWAQTQSLDQWQWRINDGKNWLRNRNGIFLSKIKKTLFADFQDDGNVPIEGEGVIYGEREFAVNQFWQGNGSLPGCGRKEIRGLNLDNFELSYSYRVDALKNGVGQFHVKFIYDGSNYVTRILNGGLSTVFTDVKGMASSSAYAGVADLYEGVHRMRFVKRGGTLTVYVDGNYAYDVAVPDKNVIAFDIYQHTANVTYRNLVIKKL